MATKSTGVKLTKERITELRAELMEIIDEKQQIPRGLRPGLVKKYGIGETAINWHRRQAVAGFGPGRKPVPEIEHKPATRDDIDFDAINRDIDAGMSAEEIRKKHNVSASLIYKTRRAAAEETPITPLSPEQCKRVIAIITRLADVHPDKFTQLDILGQITKKHAGILAEII